MKPEELIKKRELLLKNIKLNWNRINAFNVVEKGFVRDFDLKEVYKQIIKDSMSLIEVKVAIQAVNMGLSSMDALPKNSLYPTIYMLQQLKEQKIKLMLVNTKGLSPVFSKNDISSICKELDIEIIKMGDIINKFNKEQEFKM